MHPVLDHSVRTFCNTLSSVRKSPRPTSSERRRIFTATVAPCHFACGQPALHCQCNRVGRKCEEGGWVTTVLTTNQVESESRQTSTGMPSDS